MYYKTWEYSGKYLEIPVYSFATYVTPISQVISSSALVGIFCSAVLVILSIGTFGRVFPLCQMGAIFVLVEMTLKALMLTPTPLDKGEQSRNLK